MRAGAIDPVNSNHNEVLTLNQSPTGPKDQRRKGEKDKRTKGAKLNSQYLCDTGLRETKEMLTSIPEKSGIEGMMINLDNCKSDNSPRPTLQFHDFQVTRLPHPPYSILHIPYSIRP
jgi:hypothetical protein